MFYRDREFCGYRDLRWIGREFFIDYGGCTDEIWDFVESYNDTSSVSMSIIHRFMGLVGQSAWVSTVSRNLAW